MSSRSSSSALPSYDPSMNYATPQSGTNMNSGASTNTASVGSSGSSSTTQTTTQRAPKASSSYADESNKKGRKPYTITKPRESWTKEEHQFFLEALQLYERDWKKIGQHIPTKSIIQIRSHAQKYFIKMAKMGLKEFIPAPSRPKRSSKGSGGGRKGGHRGKRQKLSGDDDDDEDDEEDGGGEDGEEDEGDEEQQEDEEMDEGGALNGRRISPMKAGTAAQPSSARKQQRSTAAVPSSRAIPSSAIKRPPQRRDSNEDMNMDDASTRRSGRKRKINKRFDDDDYDSGAGEDEDDDGQEQSGQQYDDDDEEADVTQMRPNRAQYQQRAHPGHPDHDDQPPSTSTSAAPSPYPLSQPVTPHHAPEVAPTTPLRKLPLGVAGGAAAASGAPPLSQLSPLSQLTQAGTLADITSPHLLPQSAAAYNPKLKPYPGLGRSHGAGGMQSNVALIHNSTARSIGTPINTSLAVDPHSQQQQPHHLSSRQQQPQHPTHDPNDPDTQPDEGAADESHAPEFAKVYSFLGSLFDPSTSGHIEELDKMTPVNKEIVQKLMMNLNANLPAAQPPPSSAFGPSNSFSSALGVRLDLVPQPKHVRTSSLGSIGSIGSLDQGLSSPDLGHRWLNMGALGESGIGLGASMPMPSVSPTPSLHGIGVPTTSSLVTNQPHTNGSPPSYSMRLSAPGSGSGSSSSGMPPTNWSADKSRPGFAGTALVNRITRGALSPLAPLSGMSVNTAWPSSVAASGLGSSSGQASPTAGGGSTVYTYHATAMSPSTTTPMSFVSSPTAGGFFSPMPAATSAAGSSVPTASATTVSENGSSSSSNGGGNGTSTVNTTHTTPTLPQYPALSTTGLRVTPPQNIPSTAHLAPSPLNASALQLPAAALVAPAISPSSAASRPPIPPPSTSSVSASSPRHSTISAMSTSSTLKSQPSSSTVTSFNSLISPSSALVSGVLASLGNSPPVRTQAI